MGTEATEIFQAVYFLIGNKQAIKITKSVTIGRGEVDCQIKDTKLSTNHCKVFIKGLRVLVVDLSSTNGTFINGDKLAPNVEYELKLGSKLNIGSFTYILSDENKIVNNTYDSTAVSGINTSEVSPFELKNLYNFFNIHISWKIAYLVESICLLAVYYFSMPDSLFPKTFSAIAGHYHDQYLLRLVYLGVAFYLGSLFHSYVIAHYFKKSKMLSSVAFAFLLIFKLLFTTMSLTFTDHNKIESYLKTRDQIKNQPNTAEARSLYGNALKKDYDKIYQSLPEKYRPIILHDFKEVGNSTEESNSH